jgi:ABC-type branched-subunit amino acid transport system ATPase component
MLLEVKGLHVRYGRTHAVKAVDLHVAEGARRLCCVRFTAR